MWHPPFNVTHSMPVPHTLWQPLQTDLWNGNRNWNVLRAFENIIFIERLTYCPNGSESSLSSPSTIEHFSTSLFFSSVPQHSVVDEENSEWERLRDTEDVSAYLSVSNWYRWQWYCRRTLVNCLIVIYQMNDVSRFFPSIDTQTTFDTIKTHSLHLLLLWAVSLHWQTKLSAYK